MLGLAIKLGKAFGIDVYLHWSFFLVPIYVFAASWWRGGILGLAYLNVVLVLAVFACVLMHEFGHALAAKWFNIRTHDIILSPVGGLARLDSMPENSWAQFVIAIAGPMVNFVICALLFLVCWLIGNPVTSNVRLDYHQIGNILFWCNLMLGVFNLIPAYPMDGGRILRAVLAAFMTPHKATMVAARLGQAIALGFCVFGAFQMIWQLVLVGCVVFLLANIEIYASRMRYEQHGVVDELDQRVIDARRWPPV